MTAGICDGVGGDGSHLNPQSTIHHGRDTATGAGKQRTTKKGFCHKPLLSVRSALSYRSYLCLSVDWEHIFISQSQASGQNIFQDVKRLVIQASAVFDGQYIFKAPCFAIVYYI